MVRSASCTFSATLLPVLVAKGGFTGGCFDSGGDCGDWFVWLMLVEDRCA
jgi:hypothetical protein